MDVSPGSRIIASVLTGAITLSIVMSRIGGLIPTGRGDSARQKPANNVATAMARPTLTSIIYSPNSELYGQRFESTQDEPGPGSSDAQPYSVQPASSAQV